MLNGIQSGIKKQQFGFGMSTWGSLKPYKENPNLTEDIYKRMDVYAKTEASRDGNNVHLKPTKAFDNDHLAAMAVIDENQKLPGVLSLLQGKRGQEGERNEAFVIAKLDRTDPVITMKKLVEQAVNGLIELPKFARKK